MWWYIAVYLLGLGTFVTAVMVGGIFKKHGNADFKYICLEENCTFSVQSDEKGKVDNAVVSHWRFHP